MSATYIQSVQTASNNAEVLSAPSITPTAGNTLIILVSCDWGAYNVVPKLTDTQGVPLAGPVQNVFSNGSNLALFITAAKTSSAEVFTVNFGNPGQQTGLHSNIIVAEYSGLGVAQFGGSARLAAGGTSYTVPTLTGINVGDLVICGCYDRQNNNTYTFASGFTVRQTTSGAGSLMLADAIPASGGLFGGQGLTLASNTSSLALFVADYTNASNVIAHVSQVAKETVLGVNPSIRMAQIAAEKLVYPNPPMHLSQIAAEKLVYPNPPMHLSQIAMEIIMQPLGAATLEQFLLT